MNKIERIAVVVLFGLLIAWSFYGRKLMPAPPVAPEAEQVGAADASTPVMQGVQSAAAPAATGVPVAAGDSEGEDVGLMLPVRDSEEKTVTLTNGVMQLVFTSWGGGLSSVSLADYRATLEGDSGPVVFDFAKRITMSYAGLPGLSEGDDFSVAPLAGQNGVRITRTAETGLTLERTVILEDGYALTVLDRFTNQGLGSQMLRDVQLQMGPMQDMEKAPGGMGSVAYLGVDVLHSADQKIDHIGRKLPGLFGVRGGCSKTDLRGVPMVVGENIPGSLKWVAVKNKFFAQILEVEAGEISTARVQAERSAEAGAFRLDAVSASLTVPEMSLAPGETVERKFRYYAGPKKYTSLKQEGGRRTEIMEFGRFFKPVCKVLLPLLNGIERFIPGGYGVAIILLTLIVKLLFWPVTHKGTESMKRMQKLQPELKKLREKFKSDPKKLQEKQMLLYRENKVNPLAGCLPMLIQIPVFIGLFTVLRSAVELRFTRFLWIRDLSAPEGLLAGVIPFPFLAGGLNILPLLMTATMVWQQKLTPSTGDPQQQKMMAFMPVMMLFIFYNMPSALVLYWTVSQLLSILQLVMQQRKDKVSVAVVPA